MSFFAEQPVSQQSHFASVLQLRNCHCLRLQFLSQIPLVDAVGSCELLVVALGLGLTLLEILVFAVTA